MKVLFIDDSYSTRTNYSEYLREEGGHTVIVCSNRQEVEKAFTEHENFEVVILDGDLGDSSYGENSDSGKIVLDILIPKKVYFGRFSNSLGAIPESLHGDFQIDKKSSNSPNELLAALERKE